jgi:hypothetical protein
LKSERLEKRNERVLILDHWNVRKIRRNFRGNANIVKENEIEQLGGAIERVVIELDATEILNVFFHKTAFDQQLADLLSAQIRLCRVQFARTRAFMFVPLVVT